MEMTRLVTLYRAITTAREVDRVEQQLAQRGEAFFHVGSGGHEAAAALALLLKPEDWLNCHYRDKALLIARGVRPQAFFDTLLANDGSHARGRQMPGFHSDPALRILPMPTLVGNNALHCVGVAEATKHDAGQPIVVCGIGDGGTQQGEFLEGIAEAVRRTLPVLFLIQDNHLAISTSTSGQTFFSRPDGAASEFYGLPIHRIDGRCPLSALTKLEPIVAAIRENRAPALVVLEVDRLQSHTNADDQTLYRSAGEINAAAQAGDPLLNLERMLLAQGVPERKLQLIRRQVVDQVAAAEESAWLVRQPLTETGAKSPLPIELCHPARERRGGSDEAKRLTMREALREALRNHLQADRRVTLLGQDIEDPKGDVFGVTRGLSTAFPGRVRNAPLTEATILGTCIGRAMAGERPVAFLQFADFLPVAFNQIASELGALHWRTAGQWQAPVIVMIACGAYRPGLGPYHAQTLEALAAHTPGIDVLMPSHAADAAGMLNAAFQSGRPTLFFYPKSCLNDPQQTTGADVRNQFVPLGVARKARVGRDLTLVGWGNTVRICEQAADALETAGVEAEVLDLRSISPWDEQAVIASAEKTSRLIVVHEDNHTCGFGAEVISTVAEKACLPVALRRITRPDTHVPFNFANQMELLPTVQRVLAVAADLTNLDLAWKSEPEPEDGIFSIDAIGSGPADETVIVSELSCSEGTRVERGQVIAQLEATKSVFELTSPVTGVITEILANEGETVSVGKPLMRLRLESQMHHRRPAMPEDPGTPVFTRRVIENTMLLPRREGTRRAFEVGMSGVATASGSRLISNDELVGVRPGITAHDIVTLTGIETRRWAAPHETAVSLAVKACRQLFDRERLLLDDIDLVICSTTSPTMVTPSMACQVLGALGDGRGRAMAQAFDISAACSGYLYALQAGYDYLQSTPNGRVLVITAEVLSPLLDMNDFDTAILFGDAASATVLYGESLIERGRARLLRPDLSAKGEDGSALFVPLRDSGFIQMKGRKVFSEAVRSMVASLTRACERHGIGVSDLDLVVPHQANQRIIDAVQSRIPPRVYTNIREHGNTSSTSIPLCLEEVLPSLPSDTRLGLCAFGGGFTFGAGILQTL